MDNFLITLGTGPAGPIMGRGKNQRLQTSTFVYINGLALLFDTTPAFLEQIKYLEKILSPLPLPIHIFFSHRHSDATGGADDAQKYFQQKNIETFWYGHEKTLAALPVKETLVPLQSNQPVRLGEVIVTPFLVQHVLGERASQVPTFGYQINDTRKKIVMATDVSSIPLTAQKYFKHADLVLIDAAGWGRSIINHHDVLKFLEQSRGWGIKKILLTQIGRLVPPHNEASQYLHQHFPTARLAYDGMKINL